MLRLVAVVFLFLVLPLHANLGDTVAGCVKRYGKPNNFSEANARTPFGTLLFMAGPYQMIVFLSDNVEVGARISKRDKTAFTPSEIQTILNADASTPWVSAPSDDPNSPQWIRADKAGASYDPDKKMVLFTTPEMLKVIHASMSPSASSAPNAPAAPAEPPRPPGNFVPATPTQWAPPTSPSTNAAPATNAPPVTNAPAADAPLPQ